MGTGYYEDYWSAEGRATSGGGWPQLHALLDRVLPPGARVLDLGCGDGRTSGVHLAARGHDYRGVDVSATAVATARSLGLTADVVPDAAALPLPDASVDAVVCVEVLEHLVGPLAAAREALRVVRPGGVLVATTPNTAYWTHRARLAAGTFDAMGDELSRAEPWRDPHLRFFTARSLPEMLRRAGWADVVVEGQEGGLLRNVPVVRHRVGRRSSPAYQRLERARPALFGLRLAAVARRP